MIYEFSYPLFSLAEIR